MPGREGDWAGRSQGAGAAGGVRIVLPGRRSRGAPGPTASGCGRAARVRIAHSDPVPQIVHRLLVQARASTRGTRRVVHVLCSSDMAHGSPSRSNDHSTWFAPASPAGCSPARLHRLSRPAPPRRAPRTPLTRKAAADAPENSRTWMRRHTPGTPLVGTPTGPATDRTRQRKGARNGRPGCGRGLRPIVSRFVAQRSRVSGSFCLTL